MAFSTGFGGSVNNTANWSEWTPFNAYRENNGSFPAGNPRLDGSADTIYLLSVSAASGGVGVGWSLNDYAGHQSGGGTWMRGSNGFRTTMHKSASGRTYIHRNTGAGGSIVNDRDGVSLAGCFCGSFNWSNAPAAPASITPTPSGKNVTVTFTAAPDGGGETIVGYTAQYRKDGGAWTGDKPVGSVTPVSFNNLDPGDYEFRVYTRTGLASGAARVSGTVEIKSGGKRNDPVDGWKDTSAFKRDGVDIVTYRRNDPVDGWKDAGA